MARYSLLFKRSISRDLRSIPKQDVRRILKRIDLLADDPRPSGSEKLSTQELYRIRQGCYRIIYEIQDIVLIIVVVKIGKRSDVYR
jgi:mRNA interferase RelE/StbE